MCIRDIRLTSIIFKETLNGIIKKRKKLLYNRHYIKGASTNKIHYGYVALILYLSKFTGKTSPGTQNDMRRGCKRDRDK